MVLRSWFTTGLVPVEKVLEYFRGLRSRRKGKDKAIEEDDGDSDIEILQFSFLKYPCYLLYI